jgi:hypothetical protein
VYDAPARSSRSFDSIAIEFISPVIVRLGNRKVRVGSVVFHLLRTLFEAEGHARPVSEVEMEVWGGAVTRNTLWSACRRARNVLIKLDHPLRVAIDGDLVQLV